MLNNHSSVNEKLWNKDFLLISFSNFFMFLSFYILVGALPLYLTNSLNYSESLIGLIIGIFTVSQMIVRPLSGFLIDRNGRSKVFFLGRWVFLIATVLYIGAYSLFLLLVIRVIHGIGYGFATSSASTIATDLLPNTRRAEGMGYYSIFINLPLAIGPILGIALLEIGNNSLFITCSLIAALSLIIGYFVKIPIVKTSKEKFSISSIILPNTLHIILSSALIICVYGGILSFITIYASELGIVEAGAIFLAVYSVIATIIRPFSGRLSDKLGSKMVIYPSYLLCIIGLIILGFASTTLDFIMAAILIGLCIGSTQPIFLSLVVSLSPEERRGTAVSSYLLSLDIGIAGGALLVGLVAQFIGIQMIYIFSLVFVIFSILCFYKRSKTF